MRVSKFPGFFLLLLLFFEFSFSTTLTHHMKFTLLPEFRSEIHFAAKADIDNDGDVDVVTVVKSMRDFNIHLIVSLNNGKGVFKSRTIYYFNPRNKEKVYDLDVEDIDGDSVPEILCLLPEKKRIYVFKYLNEDFFLIAKIKINSKYIEKIQAAKINNDSFTDIVIYSSYKDIYYLENKGNYKFKVRKFKDLFISDSVDIYTFSYTKFVDIDNDGDSDLIVVKRNKEAILFNNKSGTFVKQQYLSYGRKFLEVDLDNDNYKDLVGIDFDGRNIIAVYHNIEGHLELVQKFYLEEVCGISSQEQKISAQWCCGGGIGFPGPSFPGSPVGSPGVVVPRLETKFIKFIDIDNDGFKDLMYAISRKGFWFIKNDKNGLFNIGNGIYRKCSYPFCFIDVFVFDADKDGYEDIIPIFFSAGIGVIKTHREEFPRVKYIKEISEFHGILNKMKALDFDGDGDTDLFFISKDHSSIIAENINNELFKLHEINYSMYSFKIADINGDGIPEVVSWYLQAILPVEYKDLYQDKIVFSRDDKFIVVDLYPFKDFKIKMKVFDIVDIDKDGLNDIITASNCSDIYLLKNKGNLNFEKIDLLLNLSDYLYDPVKSIKSGDFDGDGNIDILVSCGYKNHYLVRTDGNANVIDIVSLDLDIPSSDLFTVTDINKDGLTDIIGEYQILKNEGNYRFSKIFESPSYIEGLEDLDNNGYLDVISRGFYLNFFDGKNFTSSIYSLFIFRYDSFAFIDINNDGFKDLAILTTNSDLMLIENDLKDHNTVTIKVKKQGNGTVISDGSFIDCGEHCWNLSFYRGKITLKAIPQEGNYFAGWGGDCEFCGYNKNCVINLDKNMLCTANFEPGTAPEIVFPESIDFGTVELSEKTKDLELIVENKGEGILEIHSVELIDDNDEFKITKDKCSGKALKQSKSCKIKIRFSPKTTGEKYAKLIIQSNDLTSPSKIVLTAKAIQITAGSIKVEPPVLYFGILGVNKDKKNLEVKIKNATEYDHPILLVKKVYIPQELNTEGYSIVKDNCSGISLKKGKTCKVKVKFEPKTTGEKHSVLVIESNDQEFPEFIVDLIGVGEGGKIELSKISKYKISFGRVEIGDSEEETIKVKNVGKGYLYIHSVVIEGTNKEQFIIEKDKCSQKVLKPKKSCKIKIKFKPLTEGAKEAVLKIYSSDEEKPELQVELIGLGKQEN